jgi:indole-3-glycerol phosphate synthase
MIAQNTKGVFSDRKTPTIIAEVKIKSPFGFVAEKTWDELFSIACRAGDIIAIHTDERWGGSFELLEKAKAMTKKPILAKGIHAHDDDVARAIMCGADFVLIVGRLPDPKYKDRVFVEPLTLEELARVPQGYKVVWNSRDLATGGIKDETFEDARAIWKGFLCQASNIRTVEDIKKGADAVLVGSHLADFARTLE